MTYRISPGLLLLARPTKAIAIATASLHYSNPASTFPDLADNPVSDPYPINLSHSFTYNDPQPPRFLILSLSQLQSLFPVCPLVLVQLSLLLVWIPNVPAIMALLVAEMTPHLEISSLA